MAGVKQMRDKLRSSTKYSGVAWCSRVDRMSDSQVIAIYYRMLGNDEFKHSNDGVQLKMSVRT